MRDRRVQFLRAHTCLSGNNDTPMIVLFRKTVGTQFSAVCVHWSTLGSMDSGPRCRLYRSSTRNLKKSHGWGPTVSQTKIMQDMETLSLIRQPTSSTYLCLRTPMAALTGSGQLLDAERSIPMRKRPRSAIPWPVAPLGHYAKDWAIWPATAD